jgi:hypothetical protein
VIGLVTAGTALRVLGELGLALDLSGSALLAATVGALGVLGFFVFGAVLVREVGKRPAPPPDPRANPRGYCRGRYHSIVCRTGRVYLAFTHGNLARYHGLRALGGRRTGEAREMDALTHAKMWLVALALVAIVGLSALGATISGPLPGLSSGGPSGWRPFVAQSARVWDGRGFIRALPLGGWPETEVRSR